MVAKFVFEDNQGLVSAGKEVDDNCVVAPVRTFTLPLITGNAFTVVLMLLEVIVSVFELISVNVDFTLILSLLFNPLVV